MVASMVLAACATPTPQVIIQTQVVNQVQTQVVTVKETSAPVVQIQTQVVQVTSVPPTVDPNAKIQIRWYVGLGTGTDPVQLKPELQVVDDFNADPARAKDKINLALEVIPYNSAKDTLSTEIAAGNGPDIVGPVGWAGSNAFYGQWLDLAPYIKAANFDQSVFDPGLVKMYETSQGVVGLPFAVYPSTTFYNTKLFDEAGLNYPPAKYGEQYVMPDGSKVDWSWDTVAKVSKLLTIDKAGKHSGEAGFDATKIVQYGYTWQFETQPEYLGAFWAGGSMLASGDAKGNYKAAAPDAWVASWKWSYDAMWGKEPFIPNGQVSGSADYANGNPFNSGKVAMTVEPIWYTCCMGDLKDKTRGTWDMAAMPTYNGKVGGRIDADTFRVWKGTKHPQEAFTVLAYLTGIGDQKLIVGSKDMPAAYGALPGRTADQQPFFDAKKVQFPWVKNWDQISAGLAYPDVPSAEAWMPNFNEAWNRGQTFYSLMANTGGLDLDKEIATYIADLNTIFNK
jgi:multiple sugar transport system substrate-binding protein